MLIYEMYMYVYTDERENSNHAQFTFSLRNVSLITERGGGAKKGGGGMQFFLAMLKEGNKFRGSFTARRSVQHVCIPRRGGEGEHDKFYPV